MRKLPLGFVSIVDAVEEYRRTWLKDKATQALSERDWAVWSSLSQALQKWEHEKRIAEIWAGTPRASIAKASVAARVGASDAAVRAAEAAFKLLGGWERYRPLELARSSIENERSKSKDLFENALGAGLIKARILLHASGHDMDLGKNFWFSDYATPAWTGSAVKWFLGEMFHDGTPMILREDIRTLNSRSDPALAPIPGEMQKTWILRRLQLNVPRPLTVEEAKVLATEWQTAKGAGGDEISIARKAKSIQTQMSGLSEGSAGKKPRRKSAESDKQ